MSTFKVLDATCPACGEGGWRVEIAQGLHITRLPHIKQQILEGTFQVYTCPSCDQPTVFEAPVVYTDFERGEYIAVETIRSASLQTAVARHQTVFRSCFELGPPIAQEMGVKFRRRIVYGFRALREKILIWDAGLDDRVVEAVKGDLFRQSDYKLEDVVLRVSRVLDGGHLLFGCHENPERPDADFPAEEAFVTALDPPFDFVTAPRATYQARASRHAAISDDYPWLHEDWLVDIHDGPSYLYR